MRIQNENNFISLELEFETDASLPSFGDARIEAEVSVDGFSGSTSAWVSIDEIKSFALAVIRLEAVRRGEACLRAMSPENLELRIFTTDSVGHMAVSGILGRYTFNNGRQSLKYHFAFDPSLLIQLVKLVNRDWLRHSK